MILLTVLFLLLAGCILAGSQISLFYASMGLKLWLEKMIPALLPFMILSGIMVRLKLTDRAAMLIYPVVRPLYRVRKNVCYAMLTGFLCGFPMGAKVTADLYTRRMITKREAEYLLAFCNNIGPVYFLSFALPALNIKEKLPCLFGMYGIPLLYGLILRHTVFRELQAREEPAAEYSSSLLQSTGKKHSLPEKLMEACDDSVRSSMQSILSLGGYMILYNMLNLIPHVLIGHPLKELSPLLEITGGLSLLGASAPLYGLLTLAFGGFCCIAQTYACIGDSDLSIGSYLFHKIILTLLSGTFYLCLLPALSESFLR